MDKDIPLSPLFSGDCNHLRSRVLAPSMLHHFEGVNAVKGILWDSKYLVYKLLVSTL